MAGTWHFYGTALEKIAEGSIDIDADTFKVMLLDDTHTTDQDAHDFRSDVEADEVSGTGYTAGGATLAGLSAAYDSGSNEYRIAWTSPTWPTASFTARTAVIYKSRGGASSADELLAYCTNDANVVASGGTFTLTLPSPTLKITAS